jgi:hypothetical protein
VLPTLVQAIRARHGRGSALLAAWFFGVGTAALAWHQAAAGPDTATRVPSRQAQAGRTLTRELQTSCLDSKTLVQQAPSAQMGPLKVNGAWLGCQQLLSKRQLHSAAARA